MLEFLWNVQTDGSVSPDNARYDESNPEVYSSVSRREINRGSLSSPRSVKLARHIFSFALHSFFFLITGLIAARLVNRVPFVRFATIVSHLYSISLFEGHIVSRWFSNCFSPLVPSIIIETPCCTFRMAYPHKSSFWNACIFLLFFFLSFFLFSFRSRWVATVW